MTARPESVPPVTIQRPSFASDSPVELRPLNIPRTISLDPTRSSPLTLHSSPISINIGDTSKVVQSPDESSLSQRLSSGLYNSPDWPPVSPDTAKVIRPHSIVEVYKDNPSSDGLECAQKAASAWGRCVEIARSHDLSMIQGWKEDIDALLILIGLFSAVVTAFIVEFYKLLLPSSQSNSVQNLQMMKLLLSEMNLSSNHLAATSFDSSNPPNTKQSAVVANIFWFSSLVISLTAASLGILVKQWLREASSQYVNSPRESARIRQFRYQGLMRWRVPEIVAFLPILLQIALASFLVGLLDILFKIHLVLAAVVSVFVVASLLLLIITTILPTFFVSCPYRSPQALATYYMSQALRRTMVSATLSIASLLGWNRHPWPTLIPETMFRTSRRKLRLWLAEMKAARFHLTWREREKDAIAVPRRGAMLDCDLVVDADRISKDDEFLDKVIRVCLEDVSLPSALHGVCTIMHGRAHHVLDGVPSWKSFGVADEGILTLVHLVADILARPDLARMKAVDTKGLHQLLDILEQLCKVTPFQEDHPDINNLYHRINGHLAGLLNRDEVVQKRALKLMHSLCIQSGTALEASVNKAFISHAIDQTGRDTALFYDACVVALYSATMSGPDLLYDGDLRTGLGSLLSELELSVATYVNTVTAGRDPYPTPGRWLLLAVDDLARADHQLVSRRLLGDLEWIVTGTRPQLPGETSSTSGTHPPVDRTDRQKEWGKSFGGFPRRRNAMFGASTANGVNPELALNSAVVAPESANRSTPVEARSQVKTNATLPT